MDSQFIFLQFVPTISSHFRFPMIKEKFQIGYLSRFKSVMKIVLYFMVSLLSVKKLKRVSALVRDLKKIPREISDRTDRTG